MTFDELVSTYHMTLNAQQAAAVQQTEGPVLLLAVPGSGKTTVIVARLGYLLLCRGVAPRNVLTVTYTRAATADMRGRFASVFGKELAAQLEFRTINGVCARIIQRYAQRYGRAPFQLLPERETARIIRELFRQLRSEFPSDGNVREIATKMTYCKNQMLSRAEIAGQELDCVDFPRLYDGYQQALRQMRAMDYDDQMVYTLRILRTCPDILQELQGTYRYLQVDEAQDTSKIQHVLLNLLAAGSGNLFLVGDEDQSIYGFRAAYPQALLQFERDHPGAQVLYMEENYRSSGEIVRHADALIARNRSRHQKTMRTSRPDGEKLRHTKLPDLRMQPDYLCTLAADGVQTAILYRNNDSAVPVIDALTRRGIPYRCRETDSLFFSHFIVRDLTDILRFAFDPCDAALFSNIYYKLGCGIRKEAAQRALELHAGAPNLPLLTQLVQSGMLERWSVTKVQAAQQYLARMPGLQTEVALHRILRGLGYGDYLKTRTTDESKVNILLSLASQTPEPARFLERLAELEQRVRAGGEAGASLILSTIHASKGLEYDRVVLIDAVEGQFPPLPDGAGLREEDRDLLEEERRLFYVAVTRARQVLEVVSCESAFGVPGSAPSRFIAQLLPEECGEQPEKPELPRPAAARAREYSVLVGRERSTGSTAAFQPGCTVIHKLFGPAHLTVRNGDLVTLHFPDGQSRRLVLSACLQNGLLRLAGEREAI